MEVYDYDAAASTIKIEDITRDETNREILRRLKENDPEFDVLWVSKEDGYDRGYKVYCPKSKKDFEWLGYFMGKNTTLKEFSLRSFEFGSLNEFEGIKYAIELFCRGVISNRYIQKIEFYQVDLSGGYIFQSLRPFFHNNNNISDIVVEECQFGAGCAHQLSLVLRGCNISLKSIKINRSGMGDEQLVEIIEALSVHPQLERLTLSCMNIGRNEWAALANLLRSNLHQEFKLYLKNNHIRDEGADALAVALTDSRLSILELSYNSNITARGNRNLAAVLEHPNCNLEELHLVSNSIGDEGALIFANALASNRKLKTLRLWDNLITPEGWSCFSKVLCDASSINNTYHSNHTLENLVCIQAEFLPMSELCWP